MKKIAKQKSAANNAGEAPFEYINVSQIRQNDCLWYRLRVLLYDLHNIKRETQSQSRIEQTVDELYISEPYFTALQAGHIKGLLVDIPQSTIQTSSLEQELSEDKVSFQTQLPSVAEAISGQLSVFYEKRKASGDFRPCGPHDMLPVYQKAFGITRAELEDESFLSRLRRSGLEDFTTQQEGNVAMKKTRKKGH